MLDLEELQQQRDIKHYTIRSCTVVKDRRPDNRGYSRFRIKVGPTVQVSDLSKDKKLPV